MEDGEQKQTVNKLERVENTHAVDLIEDYQ